MPSKNRHVAVIGLGTFGTSVARELSRMGDQVLGIDIDQKQVGNICDDITSALEADATDPKALMQCGLEDYDAVIVSIGENIQASVLATLNVLDISKGQIWVKAQDESHSKILKAIGADNIIRPEEEIGVQLAHLVHNPYLVHHMVINDGAYIAELKLPHTLAGKSIGDLKLKKKHELNCLGHIRNKILETEGLSDRVLETGDALLLHGRRPALRKFVDGI